MTMHFVDLDVRPVLNAGGEPFAAIMEAVERLAPDEGLRLLATFRPTPLFAVLGAKGFAHEASEIGGGDWEVLFRPTGATPQAEAAAPATDDSTWPEPVEVLDNRELDPPEPMVRILAATETMRAGDVLAALLGREPIFLFPELAKRGHAWRGGFEPDSSYRILVRIGAGKAPVS
jgi:TusA-related sulfurtransferase